MRAASPSPCPSGAGVLLACGPLCSLGPIWDPAQVGGPALGRVDQPVDPQPESRRTEDHVFPSPAMEGG